MSVTRTRPQERYSRSGANALNMATALCCRVLRLTRHSCVLAGSVPISSSTSSSASQHNSTFSTVVEKVTTKTTHNGVETATDTDVTAVAALPRDDMFHLQYGEGRVSCDHVDNAMRTFR